MRIKFQNIPPNEIMPKGAHALLEELRTLHDRRRAAIATTLELRPNSTTGGLDDQAKRADAQAVAEQIRKGGTAENTTQHQDALTARREAADQQVTALETAITAADADLAQWVADHREEIIQHQDEHLAHAADTLTDMLASIAPARANYDAARAARRWTDTAAESSLVSWVVTGTDGAPQREYTPVDRRHRSAVTGF